MIPMRDISIIENGDKLFYELGYKIDDKKGVDEGNWVSTGNFKEVQDVALMLELDTRMKDLEYLEHHNFMLIKKVNDTI